ncbi:hypothetical protein [Halomonas sp.]|uniref:hypothetical protein n=1 Tax=Halomonas sp. TaxID=1486246 RepID=UPI00298EC988|nr:hypothetical protein [Halomonas sp.]MDW7746386.1 hypothetical protein [Halomonas sp.]
MSRRRWPLHSRLASGQLAGGVPRFCIGIGKESNMRNIIYIIGLIVVVLFILSLLGLR